MRRQASKRGTDITLTNQEDLIRGGKTGDSLDCGEHKILEFRILSRGGKEKAGSQPQTSINQILCLFGDLLGRIPGKKALVRCPGEQVDFQGPHPPSSETIHPHRQEV